MVSCDYCGEKSLSVEFMDDDEKFGCAMICYACEHELDIGVERESKQDFREKSDKMSITVDKL